MSVTKEQLAKLNPGDIIQAQRTLKVVGPEDKFGQWVLRVEDVSNGEGFTIHPDWEKDTTYRVSVVKKAKRQFKEGDTITGRELKDHMWKRGTVVATHFAAWRLTKDGTWQDVRSGRCEYEFDDFGDDRKYVLKYIA